MKTNNKQVNYTIIIINNIHNKYKYYLIIKNNNIKIRKCVINM